MVLDGIIAEAKALAGKYIWIPMKYGLGYNPVNTAFVAALLVAFSWISYRMLKGMDFGKATCIKLLPYIAAGSLLRAMKDHGIVSSIAFITPWIWILFLIPALAVLAIFRRVEALTATGIVALAFMLPHYRFSHLERAAEVALVFQISIMVSRALAAFAPQIRKNMFYFLAHMFDASTTFVGVKNGFFEQHVVARAAIGLFGPIGIFLVKIPALYLVFLMLEKEREKDFLLFLVFLVATGPGMRNLLTMLY